MGPVAEMTEWRLQGRPEPDLKTVTIKLLALVDHEDKERQRYHVYNVAPERLIDVVDEWRHKYPTARGWCNHTVMPLSRDVPRGFDDRVYDKVGEAPWWMEKLGYRENTNYVLAQRASATLTMALEALASDTNLRAGYESATYDNTSNNDIEVYVSGFVTNHQATSITAGTRGEMHVVTEIADGVWPGVFDGSTGAETIGTQGDKDTTCKRLTTLSWDATTANVPRYYTKRSVGALYNGFAPSKFVLFFTHNTGQALHNTTAGTQTTKGLYLTS